MNGKQLKNSILQWAIQGKLVPQDPNDEPASVLLERIRAEKAKLIKEKKIKKDKNESIIYRGDDNSYYEKYLATGEVKCINEEIPFEIPQGWEWEKLGNIICGGKRIPVGKSLTTVNTGYKYIRVTDMKNHSVNSNDIHYITEDIYQKIKAYYISKEDLYITVAGTIGHIGEIPEEFDNANLTENANKIVFRQIDKKFLMYCLSSDVVQSQITAFITKVGQPKLAIMRIQNLLIPVPPLKEQFRIVNAINLTMPFVNRYESLSNDLSKLNISIFELLKKSILQEAIQGKLVPQIAEEGTAQKLLEQIRKEKQKLVKEGKLKKSALTDSVIYKGDDNKYYERINGQIFEVELPFEYPNSWAILRLKDICQLIDGEKRNGKGICLDARFLRGKSSATIIEKGRFVYAGDNIILVDGENSGEVFSVPQDGYMGSTFKQLWLSSAMWKPYILAFILYYKEELRNSKRGAAIPHLYKELFYNLPIGIPPLAEQKRIAERINELSQLLK